MTKTSQLNEMAIMIYDGGCLVLKNINSLFFAIILMKNHMIEMKMKKKNCITTIYSSRYLQSMKRQRQP